MKSGRIFLPVLMFLLLCSGCRDFPVNWKCELENPVLGGMNKYENMLIVNNGDLLYCINSENGEILWKQKLEGYLSTSPEILNDTILICTRTPALHILDVFTGRELTVLPLPGIVFHEPVVSMDTVYFGTMNGLICAMNMSSGDMLWQFKMERSSVRCRPVIFEDRLIVGGRDYNLYALNLVDGTEIWRFETGEDFIQDPLTDGKWIYAMSHDGFMYKIDPLDGRELWRFEMGYCANYILHGSNIYIGCQSGMAYSINIESGQEEWSIRLGISIVEQPCFDGEVLYFVTNEPTICSVSLDGKIISEDSLPDLCSTSPLLSVNAVFLSLENKEVYSYWTKEDM